MTILLRKYSIITCITIILIGSFSSSGVLADSDKNTSKIEKTTERQGTPAYASYIDLGLNIAGIVVAIGLVLFQINRQYRSNLNLQKEHLKDKIKLQIYKEIDERITDSVNHYVTLLSESILVVEKIEENIFLRNEGVNPKALLERTSNYAEYHYAFTESVTKLVLTLEKYLITDSILKIFNMALQSGNYDLENVFAPFNISLLRFLPIDVPNEPLNKLLPDVIVPDQVSKIALINLKNNLKYYKETLSVMSCYLQDLKFEGQNLFLGGIFENKLTPRKPQNKKYIVISRETDKSIEQLADYFMHDTEWGKRLQKAKNAQQNKSV